jgi:hypothetical protein
MRPADLQRYHKLLLEKRDELSSALSEGQSRVPAAGGLQGDYADHATADSDAELQIRIHKTDGPHLEGDRRGIGSDQARNVWRMWNLYGVYLEGAPRSCTLDAPLPRMQRARALRRLIVLSGQKRDAAPVPLCQRTNGHCLLSFTRSLPCTSFTFSAACPTASSSGGFGIRSVGVFNVA